MKPTKKQRCLVKKWVNKWRPRLFLGEWFFHLRYSNEDVEPAAEISVNVPYMDAEIIIHPKFWSRDLKDQEHAIVHEMCHCHTEPSYASHVNMLNFKVVTLDYVELIREQLTQRIANIAFQQEWK